MSLSLLIVSYVVPGFRVLGFGTALVAALIFGFLNATLGLILKILTFPFTVLTFGLFWFVGSVIIGRLYDVSIPAVIAFSVAAQLFAVPVLLVVRRCA